jgi:uncharacterized membrane protein
LLSDALFGASGRRRVTVSGKTTHWLLVLSVAFNIGLVGSWAGGAMFKYWRSERNQAQRIWCPLHRDLRVSEEQWATMEPGLLEFRRSSQALCREIRRGQAEIIDMIAAGDRDALAAQQEEIFSRQQKLQGLIIEHLLAEKEVLSAEQQSALFDLMRRRWGCAGAGPECEGCETGNEMLRHTECPGVDEDNNSDGI